MTKLRLPEVTLTIVETQEHELGRMALEDSLRHCEFGDVVVFTDDPAKFAGLSAPARLVEVPNWDEKLGWSRFVWQGVGRHLRTSHALHLEWDAWVIDPTAWRDEFLEYDVVGAPWWYGDGKDVGNLGFGLRSRRIIEFMAGNAAEFPINVDYTDDLVCRTYRGRLEGLGFRWAPEALAQGFSFECVRPPSVQQRFFGFHGIFNWPIVLPFDRLRERVAIAEKSAYLRGGHLNALTCALTTQANARIRQIEALNTQAAEVKYFSAVSRIRNEDYENGFEQYECRWATRWFKDTRPIKEQLENEGVAQWRGEPLAGKKILVWHEQGYGDSILMQRYVPLVEKMAAEVDVGVPPALAELFRRNGHRVLEAVPEVAAGYDYHCPMHSLPLAFKTRRDTVPPPCLLAPAGPSPPRRPGVPLVGLCWRASDKFPHNDHRSVGDFSAIAPGLAPGADYYSLQYELTDEQRAAEEAAGLLRWPFADFAQLAAVVRGLDMVVAVCSSVANLAGSVGAPLVVLLAQDRYRDMRWGRAGGPASPWYPTATLLRQEELDDWGPVAAGLRRLTERLVERSRVEAA